MIRLHVVLFGFTGAASLPPALRRALVAVAPDAGLSAGLSDLPRDEGVETAFLLCADADASVPDAPLALPGPMTLVSPPLGADAQAAWVRAGALAWAALDGIDGPDALASLLAHAQARHDHEQALRTELVQLRTQLEERKWVDKAKGLLMLARGMDEDAAFGLLRRTSMDANMKLGEVSRSVVDAAQWAEAINRAGLLRMLSQRLARLSAQALAGVEVAGHRDARRAAVERGRENLAFLGGLGLADEAATALAAAQAAWQALEEAHKPRVTRGSLVATDAAAEAVLRSAEHLTAALEVASGRRLLSLLNLCGRQRMLVERIAKDALLGLALSPGQATILVLTATAFEKALGELAAAPLSSPEIRQQIASAQDEWLRLARALNGLNTPQGRVTLVRATETLVELFDTLAGHYERSVQVIMS
jgi:hypothetical protein